MFAYYLRNFYLDNKLRERGALTMAGERIDLAKVAMPAYIVASRDDHIVPWRSAYRSTRLLGGESTFVLGASGHIAGIVNPPAKNRRNYWTNAAAAGVGGRLARGRGDASGKLVAALGRVARAARRGVAPRAACAGRLPPCPPSSRRPGRYVREAPDRPRLPSRAGAPRDATSRRPALTCAFRPTVRRHTADAPAVIAGGERTWP